MTDVDPDAKPTMADLLQGWPFGGNPNQYVGSRHHTTARSYLERWADGDNKLIAVEKPGGRRYATTPKTAGAETDFYTYVDLDGNLAGHMEQLLGYVEADARVVIDGIVDSMYGRFPPSPDGKHALATFAAFQMVRGKRRRKEIEQQADFLAKLHLGSLDRATIEEHFSGSDGQPDQGKVDETLEMVSNISEYTFVPDPNDHLRMMGGLAFEIYKRLMRREWLVARFPAGSLITCDEPVTLFQHNPDPLRGVGVGNADEIWFPLNPETLLILTRRVPEGVAPDFSVPAEAAETVNRSLAHRAYQYIYLHPAYQHALVEVPADAPLFLVEAPGVPFAEHYNQPPRSKTTARRRKR